MYRNLKSSLAALLVCLVGAQPVIAQEPAAETDPHSDLLKTLLQAEQWNERCQGLNYFEVRLIEDQLRDVKQKAPETKRILFNNSIEMDDRLAQLDTLMADLRAEAVSATADATCETPVEAALAFRMAYVPPFMKMALGASAWTELGKQPLGQRQAFENLIGFAKPLYGPNWDAAVQIYSDELNAEQGSWAPHTMWATLQDPVQDINWQNRLHEKGFAFHPERNDWLEFRAVKRMDGTSLPALFDRRFERTIPLGEGQTVAYEAEGRMDDGRIIIMLAAHSNTISLGDLRATLFAQTVNNPDAWDHVKWREAATAFEAELLDDSVCPADYCFVFPAEASATYEANRADPDARYNSYAYELVISAAENYPLPLVTETYLRKKYRPYGFR